MVDASVSAVGWSISRPCPSAKFNEIKSNTLGAYHGDAWIFFQDSCRRIRRVHSGLFGLRWSISRPCRLAKFECKRNQNRWGAYFFRPVEWNVRNVLSRRYLNAGGLMPNTSTTSPYFSMATKKLSNGEYISFVFSIENMSKPISEAQ